MDQYTYENWVKIKNKFEQSGNTNNPFYYKACDIVRSRMEPIKKYLDSKDSTK